MVQFDLPAGAARAGNCCGPEVSSRVWDQQQDFEGKSCVFLLSVGFLLRVPHFLDIFGSIMIHLGHFLEFSWTDFELSRITFMSRVQVK